MAQTVKNDILARVYLILAILIGPAAGLLTYRTLEVAVFDREEYLEKGNRFIRTIKVEGERGNIYSNKGNLLATSVPYFQLYFDPYVAPPKIYYEKIDSLAYLLAHEVDKSLTVGAWRDSLLAMRDSTNGRAVSHYVKIAESVDYAQLKRIQEFPIFNLGRFRGGLIPQKKSERKRPFGTLASRTVGYVYDGRKIGLEGAFDSYLRGKTQEEKMFRVDPRQDIWLPTTNLRVVEPTVGADVHTTLDVNLQDIAENALLRAMKLHGPEWGTAIVMDVETGAIRAMANLGRRKDRLTYGEEYNYAIAMATEPGSTFKLASMMALLEDGHVQLNSEIDIENGVKDFYDATLKDDNPLSAKWDTISVQMAFEQSSNVGMAKLVDSLYKDGEFTDRLKSFHLADTLGLEIEGEATPFINGPDYPNYSGISKAWMAIGYESKLTPLHMLNLYNTVANDGKMMKPYLVEKVTKEGKIIKRYKPTIIERQIASRKTIEQLQILLEGVVERGTAKKLKTDNYRFAGKTGTSQQNYGKRRAKVEYQASFAGYFPADKPRYSCIVVIYNPSSGSYYGGDVAGPVFREIADMAYNSMIDVHEPINKGPKPVLYAGQLPARDAGFTQEIAAIFKHLHLTLDSIPNTAMTIVNGGEERMFASPFAPERQQYPNVIGMGLRDATFVLENKGFIVHPEGVGRVAEAIWQKDSRGRRGKDVTLKLR